MDLTDEDRQHIRGRRFDVRFEIRIDGDLDHPGISATLASLEAQLHEGWTLEFPLPGDGTHWTVLLEPGVVLHEAALWTLAEAISTTPGLLLTFTPMSSLEASPTSTPRTSSTYRFSWPVGPGLLRTPLPLPVTGASTIRRSSVGSRSSSPLGTRDAYWESASPASGDSPPIRTSSWS